MQTDSHKLMIRKLIEKKVEMLLAFLLILWLVARVFLRFEPLHHFPNDDSSIFLYVGRAILNGRVPYLDAWDHKGPLLYFIDAVGLGMYGLWGVWILQLTLTFAGFYIAYLTGRKLLGDIPCLIGILAGYYLLDLFAAGNITEEYSSSFALLSFGLFLWYSQDSSRRLAIFGIGFLFMCTFLVRPNNIGFQSAIILSMGVAALLQKNTRGFWEIVTGISLGMVALLVPTLVYFGLNNALYDFYDQAFRYNFIYVETSISSAGFESFLFPSLRFLFFVALASYGTVLLQGRKILTDIRLPENMFLLLLLFAFPMEFLLSNISGRTYNHYYLTWIPYFVFADGFLASRIFRLLPVTEKVSKALFSVIIIASFIVSHPLQVFREYASIAEYFVFHRADGIVKDHPVVDFIHENTTPQDQVLFWGFGRWLTFAVDRESPSRYMYQFALDTPGYTTDQMVEEFAGDLETERPKFIVEAIGYFVPLDSSKLDSYGDSVSPKYSEVIRFIEQNYHVVKVKFYTKSQLEEDKWIKVWMLNTATDNSP